ncbi:hypothetical protein [Butyrivibrio sp. AE3004]|uniref:hypothetical protein n=1 Tax=Butyrivibrio sp. AE3004 TaxID=1506994 RepID=UPI000493C977|nr:hypothetical protein [Butyrivibrio sp. AE3004]
MKQTNKRRLGLTILSVLCAFLICGFGKKSVELTKDNLIDLDKAIEISVLGVEETGKTKEKDTVKEKTTDSSKEKSGEAKKANEVATANNGGKKNVTIKVRIRDREIFVNGEDTAISVDELSKKIKQIYTGGEKVRLIDDYAEAHIYREADEILRGLSSEMGFKYDAD